MTDPVPFILSVLFGLLGLVLWNPRGKEQRPGARQGARVLLLLAVVFAGIGIYNNYIVAT